MSAEREGQAGVLHPTLDDYLAEKRAELAMLGALLETRLDGPIRGTADVVAHKLALRDGYWRNLAHTIGPETNISERYSRPLFGGIARWGYQRFDSRIEGSDLPAALYGVSLPAECTAHAVLANSGMAAISACLTGLKVELGSIRVLFPRDGYFETLWFAERYLGMRKQPDAPTVLFVDSISRHPAVDFLARFPVQKMAAVVIDTTCWRDDDPVLERVVDLALQAARPVLCVRSHMKLDFLGVELTRLGSAVGLGIGASAELAGNVVARAQDFLSKTGGAPLVFAIPEFMHEPAFKQRVYGRVDRIRATNQAIADRLARAGIPGLVGYPHRCFFTVELDDEACYQRLVQDKLGLAEALTEAGVCAYTGNGFGFDFATLDSYFAVARKKYVIRMGFGELPVSLVERAAEIASSYLNRHLPAADRGGDE